MTTKAVPSIDPADLVLNAGILDAVVNSTAQTFTDRLGVVKPTVLGAIQTLQAFNSRGAWAATTTYSIKDLVSNAGTWYVCVVAHTSSAAFATDTATKWRVYQGVAAADLAASGGSSLVGFIDSGAGAVPITAQNVMRDMVSAKYYGVIGNGVADDTAAMQSAHNTGKLVHYPSGSYKFSTITIASGGIVGASQGTTYLLSTDSTTADLITFTGTGGSVQPLFENFTLQALNTKTGGANLRILPSSAEVEYTRIRGVTIYNAYRCLHLTNATFGSVTDCALVNYTDTGVYYDNPYSPGGGDFSIANCHISTGQATGSRYGIYQASGGGLRVVGNKILGGTAGIVLNHTASIASGPLLINSNSIENCINYGIFLGTGSTGTFGGIEIVGNEIAALSGSTSTCIASDANGKISQLTVVGNHLAYNGASGAGVVLNGVSDFNVSANTIVGNNAAGNTGVSITNTCSNGKVGKNTYAFHGAGATVVNSSATVTVDGDTQRGTANVTTSTAYGSLYIGTVAVTFPIPFTVTPVVNAFVNGGTAGGISASATGITKSGFTLNVVGATGGGVVSGCTWNAQGVI